MCFIKKTTKEEIKNLNNDYWIYLMLLSILIIHNKLLKTYTITIKYLTITLVPAMYFNTNYITKKFGFMRTIFVIKISFVSLVGLITNLYFIVVEQLNFYS